MTQGPTSGHVLLETAQASLLHLNGGSASELVNGVLKVLIADVTLDNGAQDQYLVIDVAGLDFPISTRTKVIQQGKAYIWPAEASSSLVASSFGDGKADLPRSSEGFFKLDLSQASAEEIDLFQGILASWSSYAQPQPPQEQGQPRLVLIDESDGRIVGDLAMPMTEDSNMLDSDRPDKEPVIITIDDSQAGAPTIHVSPLSELQSRFGKSDSKIVGGAEYLSRGILFGAEKLGTGLNSVATSYTAKTKPTDSPLVFHPVVKGTVSGINSFSSVAFKFSSQVLNGIVNTAGTVGSKVGELGTTNRTDANGQPKPPGAFKKALNSSFTAFNTVADSLEASTKYLISSGTDASASVLQHRFGPDAADAAKKLGGSVRHVAVVYIDARGVARKALVHGGKSAVKASLSNGDTIVLQSDAEARKSVQQGVPPPPAGLPSYNQSQNGNAGASLLAGPPTTNEKPEVPARLGASSGMTMGSAFGRKGSLGG